jgi:hypothetical protein
VPRTTSAVFGIKGGKLDAIAGSDRELGLKQSTPPVGHLGTVSHVLFNEDASMLVVTDKGNPGVQMPEMITSFPLTNEKLAEKAAINNPKGSVAPFGSSNVPGDYGNGNSRMLFTDAGVGFGNIDLDGTGKEVASSSVPVKDQRAACWALFSAKTKSMFVTDIKTGMLTKISGVDQPGAPQGEVAQQTPLGSSSAIFDLALNANGEKDILYLNVPGEKGIQVVKLNVLLI